MTDPETGLLDPDFAPFTIDELVAAHVLLGVPEAEARREWAEALEELSRARAEFEASTDPDAIYGVTLGEGTLAALTLVSPAAAARVEAMRADSYALHAPHEARLPPGERARRRRLKRAEERRWRRVRARVSWIARWTRLAARIRGLLRPGR